MTTEEQIIDEEIAKSEDTPEISEEYAYLDRGGFSSEKFKIEVRGLPKYYGIAELKKLMNQKLGLSTSKIKRPKNGSHWLYACFQNNEDRAKAIEKLNGFSWKGKTLLAEEAKPAPDPLVRKRKQDEEKPQQKKQRVEDGKSQEERLMDATTPYWNMPYEEQLFQEFVRKSGMAPFSPADYSGYWRTLTVRNSKSTGDVMLIIALHPQSLTEEEITKLKKDLADHFSSEEAVACGIKSLYIELLVKKRAGEDGSKPTHVMGATHIIDSIQGLHFRISPEAFFQVNTAGADILYQSVIDMSEVKQDSTVVDICCGTGTIGLCFAKHCGRVLGLELVPEAVKDAKANAELNQIENCDFFTGRAEDVLPSVLARAPGGDVVAVVDPPRAGLHMRAVTQLRNTKTVSRLVYVSCSPASAVKNFVDLARQSSKTLRGAPFLPVRAVPVDMFPLTRHVELAVLFEREKRPEGENKDEEKEVQSAEEPSQINEEAASLTAEKQEEVISTAESTVAT